MVVSLSHIDTCLPCYLQDHHNRDGELLLGVPVDNEATYASVREDLRSEFNGADYGVDDVTDEMFEAALAECFADAKPDALFDSSLEPGDDDGEGPQAWFLLTWEAE